MKNDQNDFDELPNDRTRNLIIIAVAALIMVSVFVGGGLWIGKQRPALEQSVQAMMATPPVKINIAVEPANAQITIDGVPMHNPFSAELSHTTNPRVLEFRAPGYIGQTVRTTFDQDRTLRLVLVPETH